MDTAGFAPWKKTACILCSVNCGLEVQTSNADMRVVQGWVAASDLDVLAGVAGVRQVTPPEYGYQKTGSVTSAGDAVLNADDVRNLGFDGSGVKVGVGLPALLVPYPHAWRYQKVNADYLARRGAAVILEDHLLETDLMSTLTVLLDNPNKLKAMRAAMFELSHPRAAEKIASALIELAGE